MYCQLIYTALGIGAVGQHPALPGEHVIYPSVLKPGTEWSAKVYGGVEK